MSSIDHFDLVDSDGALITELVPVTTVSAPQYQLIMNGDINFSSVLVEDYVGTLVDII